MTEINDDMTTADLVIDYHGHDCDCEDCETNRELAADEAAGYTWEVAR